MMRQDKQEEKKLIMKEMCKKLRGHLLSEVCVKIESESFVCRWQLC